MFNLLILKTINSSNLNYLALKPRDALAFDILDVRRILIEDGVYDSFMRGQLRKHIDSYETLLPEIFLKK